MSKRRSEKEQAEAEVRAEEAVPAEAPKHEIVIVEAPSPAEEAAEEAPRPPTVMDWARAKGHIPRKGPIRYAGDIHRGPHVAVVMAHTKWASNSVVSEEAYDQAVKAAYSIPVGENLADRRPQEG